MNMQLAMRPAYAPSNALGLCTYVRTYVLTNVLSHLGDKSCVGNAHEHNDEIGQMSGVQTASHYAHCRPDGRESHGNALGGTRVGTDGEGANQDDFGVGTETR